MLRWLPRGTHRYERLVRPEEIEGPLAAAGMRILDRTGVTYHPLAGEWRLSRDLDVNYMLLAEKEQERVSSFPPAGPAAP